MVIVVPALAFSYSAFVVVVPAGAPQPELLQASLWAAAVVVGYVLYSRHRARRFASIWTYPRTWWFLLIAALATGVVVLAVVFPSDDRTRIDLVRITALMVIGEEVLFRGLLWDMVADAWRMSRRAESLAWAVSTVLFSVAHLQYHDFGITMASVGQVGYTAVAGLVLGWVRVRTGGLVVPILLHAGGNAILQLLR
ncbi:CPBP family intramembrane glutamic endopeptidase [Phytoactinopolyspora halotolerans]|uniref:CPBP family intramembrane metalloprotease n=1 Tax=Phytoactinopolyspora halotolerans TaxID=1981512 RepID=A0A6L9S7T1_9ACTN|nr:CPBP family intramembrane glutamic endopeptidase [Phytoactinopolyspora halotolerans]NEE00622.1 CPBP family intramembrane metalloprotease [Phytoactinopolyspora halotolerans]